MIIVRCIICQRLWVVTVDSLVSAGSRMTEDSMDTAIGATCRVDPAVLHITVALVGHTCRCEGTCHAEVIDIAAEVSEE